MAEKNRRKAGVLLHITSLPSDYGVGDLGEEAYRFIDTLSDSSIHLWQMLPVGPTGYGDSPYAARSAFAGNELMISPRLLYLDGYLDIEDAMDKALSKMEKDEQNGMSPEFIAKSIVAQVEARKPELIVVPGYSYKAINVAAKLVPSSLKLLILRKMY